MNSTQSAGHFNVFTVEEFDAPTKEDKDRKAKSSGRIILTFRNPRRLEK